MDDGELGQLRIHDYHSLVNQETYPKMPPAVPQMPNNKAEERDLEDKSEICDNIFNNPFFEMKNEKPINFDLEETETVRKLYQHHRDIYTDIYREWPRAHVING